MLVDDLAAACSAASLLDVSSPRGLPGAPLKAGNRWVGNGGSATSQDALSVPLQARAFDA